MIGFSIVFIIFAVIILYSRNRNRKNVIWYSDEKNYISQYDELVTAKLRFMTSQQTFTALEAFMWFDGNDELREDKKRAQKMLDKSFTKSPFYSFYIMNKNNSILYNEFYNWMYLTQAMLGEERMDKYLKKYIEAVDTVLSFDPYTDVPADDRHDQLVELQQFIKDCNLWNVNDYNDAVKCVTKMLNTDDLGLRASSQEPNGGRLTIELVEEN